VYPFATLLQHYTMPTLRSARDLVFIVIFWCVTLHYVFQVGVGLIRHTAVPRSIAKIMLLAVARIRATPLIPLPPPPPIKSKLIEGNSTQYESIRCPATVREHKYVTYTVKTSPATTYWCLFNPLTDEGKAPADSSECYHSALPNMLCLATGEWSSIQDTDKTLWEKIPRIGTILQIAVGVLTCTTVANTGFYVYDLGFKEAMYSLILSGYETVYQFIWVQTGWWCLADHVADMQ